MLYRLIQTTHVFKSLEYKVLKYIATFKPLSNGKLIIVIFVKIDDTEMVFKVILHCTGVPNKSGTDTIKIYFNSDAGELNLL